MKIYPHRKGRQIERYIEQFMRVFSGFQVADGVLRGTSEPVLKRIPVVYGGQSRIVAAILTQQDKFMAERLPLLAVVMTGLTLVPDSNKSPYHEESISTKRIEDAPRAIRRIVGPAFDMSMELSIYAASTEELFEILEQILLVFNPRVKLLVSNNAEVSDYITDIELTNIQPEIQYPMGTDDAPVQMTLSFTVPIRLRYPHDPNAPIIEQIVANLKDEDSGFTITTETIGELSPL